MENQITKRMMDIVGPVTDERHAFGKYKQEPNPGGYNVPKQTKAVHAEERRMDWINDCVPEWLLWWYASAC